MKHFFLILVFFVSVTQLHGQNQPTLQPAVDSMASYNNTKKLAIASANHVEYAPTIQADGKTIIYQRSEKSKYNLYEIHLANGTWGDPFALEKINSTADSTSLLGGPSISFDGNTLFFFRSVGKEGNHDIFYCTRTKEGWSDPVSIGEPINTLPYLDKDKITRGGYEAFPSVTAEGDLMYYTYNNQDIYSVTIPPKLRQFMNNIVQGFVTDEDTKAGISAKVVVTDALTSEVVMEQDNNPSDGRYTLVLPVGRSFNLEYVKDGYSSYMYS